MKGDSSKDIDYCSRVFWLVPIGRNAAFVGRYAVMDKLESKLYPIQNSVPTAVLCGLGGVGKSQVALEYAYRMRDRSADISVFWVHASNHARFAESYKRIASEGNIPGKDDPNSDALQLVRDWLEVKYGRNFFMIVDNVDDRNMFFEDSPSTNKALREYIPQCERGTVIYTTRNRDIGIDLALDRDPIFIPPMEIQEARSLLGDGTWRELRGKKEWLDNNSDGDRRVESDYLIALNNVARVLASQGKYEEAEKLHREALERSELIIGELAGTIRDQGRLAEAEEMYIALLHDRTEMLGEQHYDTVISLANLATVKARRGQHQEAEELCKRAFQIRMQTLGEHHPDTIHEMHNLACCAFERASYEEAETGFHKCLEFQNVVLGPTHPLTLHTRRNHAEAMKQLGKYQEAEVEDRQTLEFCKNLTENKEAEMAATLENIGNGLGQQGKYVEAEPIRRQELELQTAISGEKSPKTIACLNRLGIALSSQEKYMEVIPIWQRVLEYRAAVLGWDNGDTQRTLWNLALAYKDTNQFQLAEGIYRQLWDLQERIHGPAKVKTLETLIQLSWNTENREKSGQEI
ncbi:hypothetical protein P7C71_g4225, partial [Lecanoromycetidae sp. Uapishka_2]